MCNVLDIPWDVLTSGVLVHLSIRDLQAVNVAFTSTPTHRAQIKELWKTYPYECPDDVTVSLDDLKWMKSVDMKPVGLTVSSGQGGHETFSLVTSTFSALRQLKMYMRTQCIPLIANDDFLIQLSLGCPRLEVLRIPPSNVTDAGILALAQNCRHLHTLDIFENTHITDAAVEAICDNCPHLKHIGLTRCDKLTDASLTAIANSYPHLESIKFFKYFSCNDDALMNIADKCHELRSVSVNCIISTHGRIAALLAANPNLIDIDISIDPFVRDDVIIQLLQCCPLLQKLNISNCPRITDAAVIAVVEHCPQLRLLNICCCNNLSDASLIALGQHCHKLKSINISYLENISDVGIAALAAGCPLLQEFYARDTSITDAGVVALSCRCHDLHKISLSKCTSISIEAVSVIAENCPLISELSLSDCPNMDDGCLYAVTQQCCNLTVLWR